MENCKIESRALNVQVSKKVSHDETKSVNDVEMNIDVLPDDADSPDSLADTLMKRYVQRQKLIRAKYMDLRFICPSSMGTKRSR